MTEVVKEVKEVKEEDKPAVGLYTGGEVRAAGDPMTISEVYIGVGPLLIPCTRGEQKALSGDVMVTFLVEPEPTDYTKDYEFIVLLPKELADKLLSLGEPLTQGAYSKTRADWDAKLHPEHPIVDGKPVRPSHPIAPTPPLRPSPKPTV